MKMSSRWMTLGGCWLIMALGTSLHAATIGYWRFEAGNVTGDSSGNGRILSEAGTGTSPLSYQLPDSGAGSGFSDPIPQTGAANGYAIQGTGTNQKMSKFYTAGDASFTSGITVESYVNLYATDNNTKIIVSQGANSSTDGSWTLAVSAENSVAQGARYVLFQYRNASATGGWATNLNTINSGIQLEVGHDYYIAVAINFSDLTSTGVVFYVQDLSSSTSTLLTSSKTHTAAYASLYDSSLPIAIGGDASGGSNWLGTMDEIRISDTQLLQSQLLISVPEPASVGMALMGLGMIWGAARRKRA